MKIFTRFCPPWRIQNFNLSENWIFKIVKIKLWSLYTFQFRFSENFRESVFSVSSFIQPVFCLWPHLKIYVQTETKKDNQRSNLPPVNYSLLKIESNFFFLPKLSPHCPKKVLKILYFFSWNHSQNVEQKITVIRKFREINLLS